MHGRVETFRPAFAEPSLLIFALHMQAIHSY